MNYKEIYKKAEEIGKTLDARKDFKNVVYVEHCDGTKLELHYASLKKIMDGDEEWYMVFTEHNGFFAYHFEDVNICEEFIGDKNFKKLKENAREIQNSIGEKNLKRIDKDAKNFKKGIVSEPIDLDEYKYAFPDNFMSIFGYKRVRKKEKK